MGVERDTSLFLLAADDQQKCKRMAPYLWGFWNSIVYKLSKNRLSTAYAEWYFRHMKTYKKIKFWKTANFDFDYTMKTKKRDFEKSHFCYFLSSMKNHIFHIFKNHKNQIQITMNTHNKPVIETHIKHISFIMWIYTKTRISKTRIKYKPN